LIVSEQPWPIREPCQRLLSSSSLHDDFPAEATVIRSHRLLQDGGGRSEAHAFVSAREVMNKILRGAKPADLPVEQPTKFDLVIKCRG
jgi:hypothetical protein